MKKHPNPQRRFKAKLAKSTCTTMSPFWHLNLRKQKAKKGTHTKRPPKEDPSKLFPWVGALGRFRESTASCGTCRGEANKSFRDQVPKCTNSKRGAGKDATAACGIYQSFRDQVPKCTTESRDADGAGCVFFKVSETKCAHIKMVSRTRGRRLGRYVPCR